jgi:hypothetical protein
MVAERDLGNPTESSEEHACGSLEKESLHLLSRRIGSRGGRKQGQLLSGIVSLGSTRIGPLQPSDRVCKGIVKSGSRLRTRKMLEHAPNRPFVRNWLVFMD